MSHQPATATTGDTGHQAVTDLNLYCFVDFAIYPLDAKCSLSESISEIENVLKHRGIEYKVHHHGTYLQGDMTSVMCALEACHAIVHKKSGCNRLYSNVRLETKTGKHDDARK